jgi:CRISPR/Cas system CSM-associated protein Csm3 (group 7 of RAMP superfamily)
MRIGWLDIKLESELCTATGESTAGLIDVEIAHEYGLPVIPGKRLKGALREVGKELVDWGVLEEKQLVRVFGLPGQATGSPLQVYDARLREVPRYGVIEEADRLYDEVRRQQPLKPEEILAQLTAIHTRTAIDYGTGAAQKGTLRTMRVVNKGIVFRSKLELMCDGEEADQAVETLRLCAKGLRQLGLGHTRGYGSVRCSVTFTDKGPVTKEPGPAQDSPSFAYPFVRTCAKDDWMSVCYRLVLEQPVMIAGRHGLYLSTEDWIPGSALLGALAAMYIEEHRLGERAHEDEVFARIFLRGGVQFGYAMPYEDGKVFAPCPTMWQQEKNKDLVYDLSGGSPPDEAELRGLRRMVHLDHNVLYWYEPQQQVRMHHVRPLNRAIGRALGAERTWPERESKKCLAEKPDERGQLYQYVSLAPGRQFVGVMRGSACDLTAVLDVVKKNGDRLRIGRSRTAEYGNVRLLLEQDPARFPVLIAERHEQPATRFSLYLVTPMLLLDESGRPDPDSRWLIAQIESRLRCGVRLEAQQVKVTELSGYNAKWRMPKPQRAALDAGSTLVISTREPVRPEVLEMFRWGWNTGEGNGQLRAIPLPARGAGSAASYELRKFKPDHDDARSHEDAEQVHRFVRFLLEGRERAQREMQDRKDGAEKAKQVNEQLLAPVSKTKIRQLQVWAGSDGDYERMRRNVEQLKNEEAKNRCLKLIEPCEGKSKAFILSYLRMLELKVRNR